MSANVRTILCFIVVSVHAIRDETFRLADREDPESSSCPEAKRQVDPPFPTRFEVPSAQAKFLDFFDDWTLKESSDCAGEPACDVSVAPVFNSSSPLNSTALITARATCTRREQSHQLFLCQRSGTGRCLAAVRFPPRGWKLRHLAGGLISATRMQRMDAMGEELLQDFLEALFLLNVLFTLGVIAWLLREVILNKRKIRAEDAAEVTDPHLVVPSSLDIMFEGMLDAVCFIVGCGLLLVAASTFLQKFGTGTNPADVLLLCYPLIFGPVALLRIFMSFNRRLLYHNLFLKGVMIDFSYAASQRDPLLLYTYLGLGLAVLVLLFDAWQNVQEGHVLWKTMAIQTVVFTSPLYYMVSSLLDALRLEQEALKRMCMQKLEQGSDVDSIEPSSEHKLTPISEGIFCRAARERQDLNACIELAKVQESAERLKTATSMASLEDEGDDDIDYFKLMDMFWVPRLVSGKSASVSMLLVLSMPLVTLLAVLLGLASLAWLIKHRTDVPELDGLVTDVPGLTPDFEFEIMDYSLFVPKMHGTTTFSASANLERTHFMNVSVFDGDALFENPINTTSRVLTEHVPLQRKNSSYPTVVQFVASTLSKARTYRITVMEIHLLVRSMLFRGKTKDGQSYEQCYPFRGSLKGRVVAIPENLQSLQMETAFEEFHMHLPVGLDHVNASEFSVVFERMVDMERFGKVRRYIRTYNHRTCATDCAQLPNCYGHKEVREGCYFAIGPSPPQISCLDLHRRKARQNSRVQISAKFCNSQDSGNCAPTSSSDHVVTATLDFQVVSYHGSKNNQHVERTGPTSITMRPSSALGSSLYPDVPHEVAFVRGVPRVKQLIFTKGKLLESLEKPDGTQQFLISLSYNPNFVSGRFLQLYFGAILEDYSDFEVQWDEHFNAVDLSNASIFFKGLCQPALFDFQCCGGHVDTYISQVMIQKWSPKQILRGKVASKSHPALFRPRNLEIQLIFRGDIPPLQSMIRENCNVPICRGKSGRLDECLAQVNKSNCIDINLCKDRCLSEVVEQCLQGDAAQVYFPKGSYIPVVLEDLGYVSYVPNDLLPGHLAKNLQFLHWLDVQIYEPYQTLFTEDALVDVAEHCSFGSGLLSLLRPGRVNKSVSMVRIMEALVRNPNFSFNATFNQIPVLRAIFHDRAKDFIRPLGGLSSVALYQDSLRPLTLPVCLATDPRSPKFVNQDIYGHLLEKMRLAVSQKDSKEVSSSHAVLAALYSCLKTKGSRFRRFPPSACRSSTSASLEDGSQPSFFSLAPTEEAFHDLLPVCETGGWMEKDNRTILHLAAARNFSTPFMEIIQSKDARRIPNVDANYMSTHMVGSERKWIYLHIRGRSALHDASRSGCAVCVQALLAKKALKDVELNVTMFPSWWDPVFHPWMYDYLLKSSHRNRQRYKAIWGVQAIHVATSHQCSGCVEALVKTADPKLVEAKFSVGLTIASIGNLYENGQQKGLEKRTTVFEADCSFRALDVAVMMNCARCAEILLAAGADATYIVVDKTRKIEELETLQLLPKKVRVERCHQLSFADKHQFAMAKMFTWI